MNGGVLFLYLDSAQHQARLVTVDHAQYLLVAFTMAEHVQEKRYPLLSFHLSYPPTTPTLK